ncbi:MAG: cystathionine gamma-synthase [Myxococcales bacterium]|nr:MAG: cystathionine gamma-synthase [Myxococcales bacterium]
MKFSTKAIHVGQSADPATGATVIPIHLSTTFTQEGIGVHRGFEYQRSGNPTRAALEECLASLEADGARGLAFASGLAATATALSILKPGDHVVAGEDLYGGTYRLFEKVWRPLGVSFAYVDGRDPSAFHAALTSRTRLVWLETPTNPLLRLADIAAIGEIAAAAGAWLIVDNTFATPYLQRPLELGAHAVLHSTTKYIGGHSDVVGGALVTREADLYDAWKFHQNAAGGVLGPFEAWLTLRGLKTLALRMEGHCRNALHVAEYLQGHARASKVIYPGLSSHPQHELARRQMSGRFGGMVTFEMEGGIAAVNSFVKRLNLFSFAESLGGVESLACYPDAMTHGSIPEAERRRRGISEGLVRLSVGIENGEDLVADLEQALG